MGGPLIRATDEAVLAERLAATGLDPKPGSIRSRARSEAGLDPKKVGDRGVDAMRTKTFYAFVGAVPADVIGARHRRIEDALNRPWVTHF